MVEAQLFRNSGYTYVSEDHVLEVGHSFRKGRFYVIFNGKMQFFNTLKEVKRETERLTVKYSLKQVAP